VTILEFASVLQLIPNELDEYAASLSAVFNSSIEAIGKLDRGGGYPIL